MYEQEKYASMAEMEAQIKDMSEKINYMDNHINHKDFKLVQGKYELDFENFLAKRVFNNIRSMLVHEINEMNKEKNHLLFENKK